MSRFFSTKYAALTPYTPGEQPRERKYLKLNTNESPFPPSPVAQRLARQAAGDLQLYSDPTCHDLVAVAAEKLGVEKEEILFTNGSDEILNFAFMAFCDEKHPAVFPDVTYGFYPVFAALNHVPYRTVPLREDFTVDLADYEHAGGTIFLANPNAPTGIALKKSEIEHLLITNPDNMVVVDEAYVDFGAESVLGLIGKYDNLLVCQTFSKSRSLAGARLGFGAACREVIRDLDTVKYSTNPYNVNRMTMAAGIGALSDEEYFRENCKKIADAREYAAAELEKLGFTLTPSLSNFLFAKTPRLSGLALYEKLREKGVLIRHFETDRLKDYNRITVGSREQMEEFIAAVRAVLEENK